MRPAVSRVRYARAARPSCIPEPAPVTTAGRWFPAGSTAIVVFGNNETNGDQRERRQLCDNNNEFALWMSSAAHRQSAAANRASINYKLFGK